MNLKVNSVLRKQFDQVDNSVIIVFRIAFGLLIFAESVGAIFTGWVKETLVEPDFTFTVIGFEWLQPLPGNGMYFYFGLMGILGLMVMVGYYYRYSISLFTLLWTITYFMQKSHYNNHYYLLILICLFMCLIPANRYASLDVKRNRISENLTCSRWCISIFKLQLLIVFTYAALAKIYPGWLEGDFIRLVFLGKRSYPIIGSILQEEWLQRVVVYGGIIFDLLIVYFLLWPKTRIFAFGVAVVFHLFNSVVFQIGIFPYLMIAMCVFFFEPEVIRQRFLKKKPIGPSNFNHDAALNNKRRLTLYLFGAYFIFQILLPLRHYLYKGDVFWTEEGHRLSWRMMLRTKSGSLSYFIVDSKTDSTWTVNPSTQLSKSQRAAIPSKPDMIWQFAQRLKGKYENMGIDSLQIYARSKVRLNQSGYHPIIDANQDLANTKWESLKHSDWILTPVKQ